MDIGISRRRPSPIGSARRRSLRIGACALLLMAVPLERAAASTLHTLYSFCTKANCADGRLPNGGFARDASGNLYGATFAGGSHGDYGTVFELIRSGSTYKFKQIYSFCAGVNCADGELVSGKPIIDVNGAVYVTTQSGGSHSGGVAMQLVPNAKHTKWTANKLYDFCAQANCADGTRPLAGLTYLGAETGAAYNGTSPLFGTTFSGGNAQSAGVAFQLSPPRGKSKWHETVLYAFCAANLCSDGKNPTGGLIADASGNLFGTTTLSNANGLVFELSEKEQQYSETVIYNFNGGADGKGPSGDLVMDAAGNLYGYTQEGGVGSEGTVYEIMPNGANSKKVVLHNFCEINGCADGSVPWGELSIDSSGNVYGGTLYGGTSNDGVAYIVEGTSQGVLYSFCGLQNCTDGGEPVGAVPDGSGNLFGATDFDGANGFGGTLFELTP